ncbi:MAG: hypothetical protein HRT98_04515 [Mycoplasmatales bacterium]|nr:hypothetical protein [Mycoplasmatales bacterium]
MKKTTLTIGAIIAVTAPLATVISCGSEKSGNENTKTTIKENAQNQAKLDKTKLEKAYAFLTNWVPHKVLDRMPSEVKNVTPNNILETVFGIKNEKPELKDVTFNNIKVNANDANFNMEVEFDMQVHNITKHFKKTLGNHFFMDQDRSDYLYLKHLEAFRFTTSLKNDGNPPIEYWDEKYAHRSPGLTQEQFYKNAPRVNAFGGWGGDKNQTLTDYLFINDPRATDRSDLNWLRKTYKSVFGFDIHDENKTFKGKTYAEWFKGVELMGIKRIKDEDETSEYGNIDLRGGRTKYLEFPLALKENGKYDWKWEELPNYKGGSYGLQLFLRKGTQEVEVSICIVGWSYYR